MATRKKSTTRTTRKPTASKRTARTATGRTTKATARAKATRTTRTTRTAKPTGTRRRKSTAEPKRIINRKKTTAARKTTGRAAANRAETAKARLADQNKQQADLQKAMKRRGATIESAAESVGVPVARAKRLLRSASVSSSDRIVGTDTKVGAQIKKLKDSGVPWPEIRARTGLSGAKIRSLYEQSGGTGTTSGGGRKKTTAKAKATRKAGRKKTTATATTKGKRAPKSRTRKTAAAEDAGTSGELRGRRGRRAKIAAMLDEVHDLDTTHDRVSEIVEGRTIEVTFDSDGHKIRPMERKVEKVISIEDHDRHGRVIAFLNEAKQRHYASTREITALK